MRSRLTLWRSRVARSVFLLFLACALAPLVVQALLAGRWVEQELVQVAQEGLDQASRGAQMSVVENLQHLDRSLGFVEMSVGKQGHLAPTLDEALAQDFLGFAQLDGEGRTVASSGSPGELPALSSAEQTFLDGGKTLLTTTAEPDDAPRVFLLRRVGRLDGPAHMLAGRVRLESVAGVEQILVADADVLLTDAAGRPLFTTLQEGELDADLLQRTREDVHGDRFRWSIGGEEHLASLRTIFMAPQYHANWRVLYLRPEREVVAPVATFRDVFLLVLALTFWVVLLVSNRQIQRVLQPLEALKEGTERIAEQDFDSPVEIETGDEFAELGESFNLMSRRLRQQLQVSSELHAIGMAISVEHDSRRVVELVLRAAQSMLDADTGCVFRTDEDGRLELARVHVDKEGSVPFVDARRTDVRRVLSVDPPRSLAALSVRGRGARYWKDWREVEGHDLTEEHELERDLGFRREAVLSVPLHDHEGDLIGVFQLGRRARGRDEAPSFDQTEIQLFEAIASQAAVAISKNSLIAGFREMMMSMTEVFAMAVDQKSPYTGAHCRRVPELTMMMVDSAARAKTGSLAEFRPTPEERFELEVAALLHDCGKVVTPVHVMDKATKLETIHDRISLVDLRFEVLERDARIAALEARLASLGECGLDEQGQRSLEARRAELEADRDFLRACNVGSEKMPEEDKVRVRAIAAKYSLRGPDGEVSPLLDADELENLTIPFGTLTAAERKIINDHIVVTIEMLEALKYPKGLRNVPILAGAHHERMDGKGYPRGLTRDEIPLGGRIMGIADVFEALTDADRPYKKGKTLQEALEILGKMATNGHLDPELFQLFMDDRIYLRFAERYLEPERIGTVDLSRIPGYVPRAEGYRQAG